MVRVEAFELISISVNCLCFTCFEKGHQSLFLATGNALVKCGQAQLQIGNAEREFMTATVNNFLTPLHNFLEGDMKTILVSFRILNDFFLVLFCFIIFIHQTSYFSKI